MRRATLILLICTAACDPRQALDAVTKKKLALLSAADVARVDSLLSHPLRLTEDQFGQPIDTIDRREILRLLKAAQYDSLERILNERWEATRRDIKHEARLAHAYNAFLHNNGSYEPTMMQWIAARPTSGAALVALSTHYTGRALHARGAATAATTSEESFEQARRYADRAMRAADDALKLFPDHLTAYINQITVIQYGGASESARVRSIVEAALAAHPASYELRATVLVMLQPRWGGSFEAMGQFAATAADFVPANPKLRVIAGAVAQEQSNAANGDDANAHALLDRAAAYGEHYRLAVDYGELYSGDGRLVDALEAYQRALALSPQGRSALDGRAGLLVDIGALIADTTLRAKVWAEAERSFNLMLELRAPYVDPSRWLEALAKARAHCASNPPPCRKVY